MPREKVMFKYMTKKIIVTLFSLFCVVTICFILFEFIPGEIYEFEIMHNETYIINMKEKYGLDKGIIERYLITLKNFIKFDFGYSYINEGLYTNDVIREGFSVSAPIGVFSVLLSILTGSLFGVIISSFKNIKWKTLFLSASLVIMSVPSFVIGIVLQYILCVKLHLFNVFWDNTIKSYILPVLVLSLVPAAHIIRMLNINIEKEKNEDYVVCGMLRGINHSVTKYMFVSCVTPIISYVGQLAAGLLVGSFAIETIFNIPGLGRQFVTSVINRDYPLMMGLAIFYSTILIFANFFSDIMICIIEPRIKERIVNEK
jgi:ABC-type dipeptide/oligopeptide/nickel transport system permease component